MSTANTGQIWANLIDAGLGELVRDLPELACRMRAGALPETDIAVLVIVRDEEPTKYRAYSFQRLTLLQAILDGHPDFAEAIRLLIKYDHPGDTCIVLYHEHVGGETDSYAFVFQTSAPVAKENLS
jgi:hypothetical protein